MAHELDDLKLWLPSEFLADDDLLTESKTGTLFGSKNRDDFWNGFGNSFGLSSDLSSPVPSATGTTETESDDDEFISELTRKVARSTLCDASLPTDSPTEGWKLPGSPQSTLCSFKPVPKSDPNFASRVRTRRDAQDVQRWDFLYAAAEEAARMRLIAEAAAFYSTKVFGQPPKPNPVTKSQLDPNQDPKFYRNQVHTPIHHSYHQLQAARFQQMKKQQLMKNGGVFWQRTMEYQNRRRNGLSMWPTLQQSQQQQQQQQLGSGTAAVFLGGTKMGKQKERIGTGVFMPRRFGSNVSTQPRKKSGCSTDLLPDKVVHALNLKLDPINARVQPRLHDAVKQRNIGMLRKSSVGAPEAGLNQEFRLPQEWTY